MSDVLWLWAAFTIVAAASQTARNAMQRELIVTLGTLGATLVRFLYGFPFALVLLAGVVVSTGMPLPHPSLAFWPWVLAGTVTQILATALMLAAMGERSFVVAIAYIKTEPVQVAVFGFLVLGDALTFPMVIAIVVATAGVIVMSFKPRGGAKADALPTLLGLGSGAMFALSAVTYRGAILSLEGTSFVMAATFTVAIGLALTAGLLSIYLALRNPAVLIATIRAWRPSLFAGLMGAVASECWFLAFALATAASVRTLGLVEVLFAQAISSFVFKQTPSRREAAGIVLVVVGVALLIWAR
jgi:drug/metabolite transporter (DMT)-like permease